MEPEASGWVLTVGYIAGSFTTLSFVPQVWQIWKAKSAKDVSTVMFSMDAVGLTLWLIYGFKVRSWPILFTNSLMLVMSLMIIYFKFRYERGGSRRDARNGEKKG